MVPQPLGTSTQVWAVPRSLAATCGVSLISFPRGTEMFHFPRYRPEALCIQTPVSADEGGWVPPFGNPRIIDCLHLPGAYRSLPRPSSPDSAKAFTARPYTLGKHHLFTDSNISVYELYHP